MTAHDDAFMELALRLARRGFGRTAPNPAVGAVIVAPGDPPVVIARGWTQPGGRPHAETMALATAGPAARGATLYVTLEPCAHHGQTPPCADAIIDAGVGRVVCAIEDPDPRVAGQGLARLEAAGIEMRRDVRAEAARWVTLGHILRVRDRRPFVQLKIATGSDGRLAPGRGRPVWVTGPEARAAGHLLRARADAILVGRGTVEADDPALTCRLPGLVSRSPIRILLDTKARLEPPAALLGSLDIAPLWHVSGQGSTEPDWLRRDGVRQLSVETGADGRVDPAALLRHLADEGVTRLLIEGGPHVARASLDAGLVDEVVHFQGTEPAGPGGLLPFVDRGLEVLTDGDAFDLAGRRPVGQDSVTIMRRA